MDWGKFECRWTSVLFLLMDTIKLGDYNHLKVVKEVDFGLYLDGGEGEEILLPKCYVPQGCQAGDELEVFIYLDQEERLVATTEQPLAKVGDFACLEVSWVNEYGAFLNWGLMKDLFCPFREQKNKMRQGERHLVHVHVDEDSYRIMASAKVERYMAKEFPPYQAGDEVDLLIWQPTDLGFKVIVNNRYAGLVYRSQVFKSIKTGDRMRGYISAIRPDGKIDVSLQPTGRRHTADFAETLLQYLQSHQGFCHLGDKSEAKEIQQTFEVSKKVYKKAIGDLYKRRLITIEPDGIHLAGKHK